MELYHIISTALLTVAVLFIGYYYWKAVEKLDDRITTMESKLAESTPDVEKIFETLEETENIN
ncbi:hypothetical protein LCDVSa172L [Lymphocystis disease virus 3]|uniref:Uncharacterized protein n=1 Tax=Lymphocystis disease virus 3 TaxID=2560566 RepID=A0A1B2RWA3_9VIRU|nr:hypothetical protein BZK12_gp172 [Lymphocystis disease virus Sa]AOC55256.1 hypothetical protein LCDVSa172L [Lymphocystis disease virus 3]